MTPEQEAKLRELHSQGMSTRAIAEALGLKSHVTIANWKKELGLTKPKPEEDPVTDQVLDLIGGNSQ